MIAVPTFHRRENADGERQWSALIPVWKYNGVGYDVTMDSYKHGLWNLYVRLTFAKRYHMVSFRLNWGSSWTIR